MANRVAEGDELHEIPLRGRNVPFQVYTALKDLHHEGDRDPTCPCAAISPTGYLESRTKTERCYQGVARRLTFNDFARHYDLPKSRRHFWQIGTMWMDEKLHVYYQPYVGASIKKKVNGVWHTQSLGYQQAIRVFSGFVLKVLTYSF